MLDNWWKELLVRGALKRLARQRVALVLQPGNVWVIENAVPDNEETDAALKTCFMRGWVEPLENSVPKGSLTADGKLPNGIHFDKCGLLWKLTDSGWSAINRVHEWTLIGILLTALGVLVTVA